MTDLFTPILIFHITCGMGAVLTGVAPILTRKGGPAHRLSGRVFAGLMAALLVAAWVMTAMRFSPYLAGLSATATMAVFSGVRVLRRKRPDVDPAQRATWLDWGVTLGVVAMGGWILTLVLTGGTGNLAAVSAALAGGALAYGGWDLWRFARPTDWPFSPNLWRYEHLAKMLGAYGAVLAAFSGNFLTVIPAPWSQLWPSLTLQPLAMIWIAVLIVGLRRRTGAVPA